MIEALRTLKNDTTAQENEDVFYVLSMLQLGRHVANLNDGARFSLEIMCDDVPLHRNIRRSFLDASNRRQKYDFVPPFAVHKPFGVLEQLLSGAAHSENSADKVLRTFLDVFFSRRLHD